jgi:CRP-like cAMP-binding protein
MHFVSSGELRLWVSRAVCDGSWPDLSQGSTSLMAFLNKLDQRRTGTTHGVVPEPEYLQVGKLHVGDMFGQISCVKDGLRVCSASAAACSEIYTLPRRAMQRVLETSPMLALDMQDFGMAPQGPLVRPHHSLFAVEFPSMQTKLTTLPTLFY